MRLLQHGISSSYLSTMKEPDMKARWVSLQTLLKIKKLFVILAERNVKLFLVDRCRSSGARILVCGQEERHQNSDSAHHRSELASSLAIASGLTILSITIKAKSLSDIEIYRPRATRSLSTLPLSVFCLWIT